MNPAVLDTERLTALQQPDWENTARVRRVREILALCPPLVGADDAAELRSLLARVAAGEAVVMQSGDCAEDPDQCTPDDVRRKSALIDMLGCVLGETSGLPVIRVGRIAGQFAKPRSKPHEQVGELTLAAFRGHMVNLPDPDPELRRPDPRRILGCYQASRDIVSELDRRRAALPPRSPFKRLWTSHEALLLDYEVPMIRALDDGTRWLGSTHWPWIGDRTRQPDGAHVRLLSTVTNPVACKVGPGTGPEELLALCERLDPQREPGRLTLIARMGADFVAGRLPPLVRAVQAAGHPVVWLCDPMHGNTVTAPNGRKTRVVPTVLQEIRGFRQVMAEAGAVAGGLHLETTPEEVTECVADLRHAGAETGRHTTFCDPRLNARQAVTVISGWARTD